MLNPYKTVIIKACIFAGFFVIAASVFPVQGQAQSRDNLNRLNRLENELETLSRAVYRGENPPENIELNSEISPRAKADMTVRLQQLEGEIRALRGTLEQQTYDIGQLREQLERSISDMELRVGDLERNGTIPNSAVDTANDTTEGASSSTSPPDDLVRIPLNPPAQVPPPAPPQDLLNTQRAPTQSLSFSDDNAAAAYENAFALLKSGQYEVAGREFLAFLNKFPDHVLSGNAKYWLGETFYVQGDYERAARIFAEGYKEYPQSAKTADNLLKLGLSLASMNNKVDACVALGQLKSDFAASPSPVTVRGEEEAARLGC